MKIEPWSFISPMKFCLWMPKLWLFQVSEISRNSIELKNSLEENCWRSAVLENYLKVIEIKLHPLTRMGVVLRRNKTLPSITSSNVTFASIHPSLMSLWVHDSDSYFSRWHPPDFWCLVNCMSPVNPNFSLISTKINKTAEEIILIFLMTKKKCSNFIFLIYQDRKLLMKSLTVSIKFYRQATTLQSLKLLAYFGYLFMARCVSGEIRISLKFP